MPPWFSTTLRVILGKDARKQLGLFRMQHHMMLHMQKCMRKEVAK